MTEHRNLPSIAFKSETTSERSECADRRLAWRDLTFRGLPRDQTADNRPPDPWKRYTLEGQGERIGRTTEGEPGGAKA
jgi:hypothetical protein